MCVIMGQTDGKLGDAKLLSQLKSSTMQANVRLTTLVTPYLDFPPSHIADTGPERLGDGFLGRPSGSQSLGPAGTVTTFSLAEDAFKEAIAVPRESVLDAFDLDKIDANSKHVSPGRGDAFLARWFN